MHWLDELNLRRKELGYLLRAQIKEALEKKPAFIAGSDEVGYGAWAGPLVVCAVVAPYDWSLEGLKDSKQLSELQREELVVQLYKLEPKTIQYFLVQVSAERIDELGVGVALRKAHQMAMDQVRKGKDALCVVDGAVLTGNQQILSLAKADTLVPQVMAASIIAKHARDGFMKDMSEKYPGYGFENHVGYGTPEHKAAIKRLGPCALHRKSYKPFKETSDEPGYSEDGGDVQEAVRKSQQIQRDADHGSPDVRGQREAADGAGGAPGRKDRGRRRPKA